MSHAGEAEFAQGVEVADVGGGGAGDVVGEKLHFGGVVVDGEDVVAEFGQGEAELPAEAAKAQDGDLHGVLPWGR